MTHLVYVTTANLDEARRIGWELVERRLAACANIVPKIDSIYWWKDEVCQEEEALLFLKTTSDRVEEIVRVIKELHSYEVPSISYFKIEGGNPDFLRWINEEVR